MPDRIIRDQARRSPTLQALSDAAERAWWRLTITVDDQGRFEADPTLLLAELFKRRPIGWTAAKMSRVITEWAEGLEPLIHLYQVSGTARVYGHAVKFLTHQRRRDSRPRHPDPPCGGLPQFAAKCGESRHFASVSVSERREPRDEGRRASGHRRQPAATGSEPGLTPTGQDTDRKSESDARATLGEPGNQAGPGSLTRPKSVEERDRACPACGDQWLGGPRCPKAATHAQA